MSESVKTYLRSLLRIAFPIMISNVISQVQMLIDKIFLGRMDPLYMSALGNVSSSVWTTMSVCFSLVTGASILISQNIGAGDREKAEEYASSMLKWHNVLPFMLFLFWMIAAPIVFKLMGVSENLMPMCLSYIRWYAPSILIVGVGASYSVIMQTSNYTKPLVLYGLVRSLLNIILDWIMIFGNLGFPQMGITGAAIATTIAEYTGLIVCLLVCVRNKKIYTNPPLRKVISAKLRPYLRSSRLGINTGLEDFAWNFGNLCLIMILNTINEMAAGIYSIIFGIEILAVVLIGSIGNGTLTLCSEATGQKSLDKYNTVSKIAYALCAAISAFTLIMCRIFPSEIMGIFTKDESIIASSGLYLTFMGINLFSKSGNIIVGNSIRGSGDTRWMFLTQIFGTCFVVFCAVIFVFVFHFAIAGVFLAVMSDEFVRFMINLWKLRKIVKNWDKA